MSIYSIMLFLAAGLALIAAAILRVTTAKKHPVKACAQCGKRSSHGYSKSREADASDTVPLCVDCLLRRLDEDYSAYAGHAVVVQPVAELPCYVFRPKVEWSEAVKNDLELILAGVQTHCHSCGLKARYAWVNALEPGPGGIPFLITSSRCLTGVLSIPFAKQETLIPGISNTFRYENIPGPWHVSCHHGRYGCRVHNGGPGRAEHAGNPGSRLSGLRDNSRALTAVTAYLCPRGSLPTENL